MSAITDFIFGKKLRVKAGEFDYVDLDVTDVETYEHDSQVTDHPVEGDQNIIDHVRVLPIGLSIEALVTNHAISKTGINLDFDRAERTYVLLKEWQASRKRLTAETGLDEFDGLILKSFSITRDRETGAALPVRLNFREIQIVESQTSTATAPAIKAAKAKKQAAKKAKKEEKRVSLLEKAKQAISAIGGR